MKTPLMALSVVSILCSAGLAFAAEFAPLPKGFREWVHTKSMVIPDKTHGLYGFHNIYANKKAIPTLKSGGTYPDGAAFVVSFYEVKNEGGASNQGAKIMDAVMVKTAKAKATGGWAYGVYDPMGKKKAVDVVKGCYECHNAQAKATDYVFEKYID
ncbi:MAG TPA: cytochrome P460 family protein [Oligoflexus sp.]|uniref:cytochrome P460 family protein n=1 Tax=Oligoflexus sp. TaxID=1971216 RepID=UPI002D4CA5AE|nr:cytochrome P460 family protein [Oligoflexus sp.]HYX32802.1 cytochrome P460 family protein [Oligoflexus sp.]